jgi:hypothetical protein
MRTLKMAVTIGIALVALLAVLVGNAVMTQGKSVGLTYNTTPSTVPNCDAATCRELLGIGYSGVAP